MFLVIMSLQSYFGNTYAYKALGQQNTGPPGQPTDQLFIRITIGKTLNVFVLYIVYDLYTV